MWFLPIISDLHELGDSVYGLVLEPALATGTSRGLGFVTLSGTNEGGFRDLWAKRIFEDTTLI